MTQKHPDRLPALTTGQIHAALVEAGMGSAAKHGNVYNQIRAGLISDAVGTLKAGCAAQSHKKARRALRLALSKYL